MKAAFLALASIGLACETRDATRSRMAEPGAASFMPGRVDEFLSTKR